jgi:hypothetical protein
MRVLSPPAVKPSVLLAECIRGVVDSPAAARLKLAEPSILATAATYDDCGKKATLHLLPQVDAVDAASAADMIGLYKDQMVGKNGSARGYYDLIKAASPHGKCPLCGVGIVRTLDHHLPKSKYPDLSVCPSNLVPACDFCQTGKLSKHPANEREQTLHPYYDNFNDEQWIVGTLSAIGNPVVQFYVAAPTTWNSVEQQRVKRHFDVFRLALVYTSNANDDLSTMREQLVDLASRGGAIAVRAHLESEQKRWNSRLNSWQYVMYQTLANDDWFVNGGYTQIPL